MVRISHPPNPIHAKTEEAGAVTVIKIAWITVPVTRRVAVAETESEEAGETETVGLVRVETHRKLFRIKRDFSDCQ